jgi:hypothetical protein
MLLIPSELLLPGVERFCDEVSDLYTGHSCGHSEAMTKDIPDLGVTINVARCIWLLDMDGR